MKELEEGWSTMAQLQREGKARWIGVSNFNVEQMKRAQAIAPITSLQPPYSLVTRQIEEDILPYTNSNHIGVIAYSPMAAGLLTGSMTRERAANFTSEDWRKRLPNFQEPLLSRNLRLVEFLREIGKRHGRSPGQVAIAWALANPAITGAIVGFRSPQQVSGILDGAEFRLSQSELTEIEEALKQEAAA
jgi:aryl-alcohol dehydrogenase-like predicted oxidoreductase